MTADSRLRRALRRVPKGGTPFAGSAGAAPLQNIFAFANIFYNKKEIKNVSRETFFDYIFSFAATFSKFKTVKALSFGGWDELCKNFQVMFDCFT